MVSRWYVYRHFGVSGELLYVGTSMCPLPRNNEHRVLSHWFHDVRSIKIEPFRSRVAAIDAERQAIYSEHPKHNKIGHAKPPPEPPAPRVRRTTPITEAAVRRVIHLGTAEAAAKLRISKAWYIELRRRLEEQDGR